ncbi:alpha-L-rhamnosidase C-terminal domain-containing protein [Amycolatopsis sp. NPDC051372]|uniref:alpha-L-rhamnosidase-related protein n=1 Tax=Amycolatopsis sp. NPDC051372 TaxID=3155669 RepID=UPI00342DC9A9
MQRGCPKTRWVEFIERHNPDAIWRHARSFDYGDWLSVDEETDHEIVATAYYAHSADLTARAAGVLGDNEQHDRFATLAGRIRSAFAKEYLGDDGRVGAGTQTAQLMALAWDLVPFADRGKVLDRLVESVERRGYRLTTGFLGVALLCPALSDNGRADVAHKLLAQTEYPSWGYSIKNGATTIWERWDGWTLESGPQSAAMNSYNHYSLGSVGQWLFEGVAGLAQHPDSVAWDRLQIAPQPGGSITRAAATYRTPRGLARSAWSITDGQLRLDVEIPVGATAEVHIPTSDPDSVRGSGADLSEAPFVSAVSETSAGSRLSIGSGTYTFTAVASLDAHEGHDHSGR